MFFWSVAGVCAALDRTGVGRVHSAMDKFFLNYRNLIRVQSGGTIANEHFPLDAASSHHYERLKGYFLSFYSIPLLYIIFSFLSFFIVLSLSFATTFCFNRSTFLHSNTKRTKFRTSCISFLTLLANLAFIFCLLLCIFVSVKLYRVFPKYHDDIEAITNQAESLLTEMSRAVDSMNGMESGITNDVDQFTSLFSLGTNALIALGMDTTSSHFDNVRTHHSDALQAKTIIDDIIKARKLGDLYHNYIRVVLPDSMQVSTELITSYNRSDVFEKQLNLVFDCETNKGEPISGCVDLFEQRSEDFFRYLDHVKRLLELLLIDAKDWPEFIDPRVKILLGEYASFLDVVNTNVSSHFEVEYEKRLKKIEIAVYLCPCFSLACSFVIMFWLFFKGCPVTLITIVNGMLVIAISALYGYVMAYVGFLENSCLNFDGIFVNSTEPEKNLYYGMFQCENSQIGASTEFWNFTSGRELPMSLRMDELALESLEGLSNRSADVLEPVSFFYMVRGDEYRIPYYRIDDTDFRSLMNRNIATDFSEISSLYDPDREKTEELIINTWISNEPTFADAYEQLLAPGKRCQNYKLSNIQHCPIAPSEADYTPYVYLSEHRLSYALRTHLSATHDSLKEFSSDGDVYYEEMRLLDDMSLIINKFLYEASNYLSEAYFTIGGFYEDYKRFLAYPSVSGFGLYYGNIQSIVNGSCLGIQEEYNAMRSRLVDTGPQFCMFLFVSTFLVIFLPCVIALMNFWYKSVVKNRIVIRDRRSGGMPQPARTVEDTSSETTFGNDEAMNKVPRPQEEDEYSDSEDSPVRPVSPVSVPPIPELHQSVAMLVGQDFANMIDTNHQSIPELSSNGDDTARDPLAGFHVDDSDSSL